MLGNEALLSGKSMGFLMQLSKVYCDGNAYGFGAVSDEYCTDAEWYWGEDTIEGKWPSITKSAHRY